MAGVQSTTQKQRKMYLSLLEEVFPIAAPAREMSAIWAAFPDALMENVLLLLPAVSQARFCTVCKPWWRLMMSSTFQHQTALIALRSGKAIAMCSPVKAFDTLERLKVVKMILPADVDEEDLISSTDWCAQGGLLALMVRNRSAGEIRIFVFNPVKETACEELPRLPWGHVGELCMVVVGDNSFRLVVSYYTTEGQVERGFWIFSSTSCANGTPPMTWSRIVISGSWAHQLRMDIHADSYSGMRLTSEFLSKRFIYAFVWYRKKDYHSYGPVRLSAEAEYVSEVPIIPLVDPGYSRLSGGKWVPCYHSWCKWEFLPSCGSEALFAVLKKDCTIFKLDDGSTVWTAVARPPQVLGAGLKLLDAEIVGDILLMVVHHTTVDVVAYHTVLDLWTRVCRTHYGLISHPRLHIKAFLELGRCPKFIAPRGASVDC